MPQPIYGANQVVTAGLASVNTALSTAGAGATMLGIIHGGPGVIYVRIGKGAQTATSADCPVVASQAGATFIPKKAGDDNVAVLAVNSSVTVQITPYESGLIT